MLRLDNQKQLTVRSAELVGRVISLEHLSVRKTVLSEDESLKAFGNLRRLKKLCLGPTSCTLDGLENLRTGLEHLELESGFRASDVSHC